MRKYTLRELRELKRLGMAIDATNAGTLPARYEKIGYSSGVYGLNGGLIQDTESGVYYVILSRCTNLFRIFF